jgi:protein-S-isoprenylcysteine O-methyltransferase Ste14
MSISCEPKKHAPLVSSLKRRIQRDLQFSGIFTCDLLASLAHVGATIYLLEVRTLPHRALVDMSLLVGLFLLLHLAKISMIFFLEKRGGDAREFIGSDRLVTEGVYKYSRNPAYLISIAQSVTWSLVLLRGGLAAQPEPVSITVAIVAPIAHFLSIDRWIIPNEEAALRRAHPEAFAEYSRTVNRWFGRRTATP